MIPLWMTVNWLRGSLRWGWELTGRVDREWPNECVPYRRDCWKSWSCQLGFVVEWRNEGRQLYQLVWRGRLQSYLHDHHQRQHLNKKILIKLLRQETPLYRQSHIHGIRGRERPFKRISRISDRFFSVKKLMYAKVPHILKKIKRKCYGRNGKQVLDCSVGFLAFYLRAQFINSINQLNLSILGNVIIINN